MSLALSRREALGGMAAALAACSPASRGTGVNLQAKLERFVRPDPDGPLQVAGAGLLVRREGEIVARLAAGYAAGLSETEIAAGVPMRALSTSTKLRFASVSKLGVALTALSLADEGLLDLDADVQAWWPGLANPGAVDAPITLAHLLSHRSTIIDPDAYWIPAPGRIEDIVTPSVFTDRGRPGEWFEYSNLNYGIAATILERASGQRFDRLAKARVFDPLGLRCGYNWSGVPSGDQACGATLYRRHGDDWRIEVDGPETLQSAAPSLRAEPGFELGEYEIGSNGTLFGPQGGLRASIEDMAVLAAAIGREQRFAETLWSYDPASPNGDTLGGAFAHVGYGAFQWRPDGAPIPGVAMIGHDGEAYGLYSGAWRLPDLDAEFAFAVTGTPDGAPPSGGRHPGYHLWYQAMLDLAAEALA